jgi:adenylosuccinate synthase
MITVVVGGQYGGEGKGKVSAYLAYRDGIEIACRCGGPNSSHTVVWNGKTYRLRMMPTAAVINPRIDVYFGAGTLIHIPTLRSEIQEIGYSGNIFIDKRAGIITDEIVNQQRADGNYAAIGSTLTGTGYASAMRCLRTLRLAGKFPELQDWVCDLTPHLMKAVGKGRKILVEGHQGYGLSNYHGDYPFTSSRDSTAASMLAELGLGPIQKSLKIVLVAKMFPTRNHQGELCEEIPLSEADSMGIREYGGGSFGLGDRRRRVGLIDLGLLARAVFANSASEIALTGIDYLYHELRGKIEVKEVHSEAMKIIDGFKKKTGAKVNYLSTGPETLSMVDLTTKQTTEKKKRSNALGPDLWNEN